MPVIEQTILINRPVGEVFRFVADFNNTPQWQPDVEQVFQTEPSLRTGVMVTESRRLHLMGWKLDLNADIIAYQPNRMIEFKGVLGSFPLRAVYTFETARGATQFTQSFDVRMGFLYGLFAPMMSGVIRRRTQRSLAALKQMLEARAAGTDVTPSQTDPSETL